MKLRVDDFRNDKYLIWHEDCTTVFPDTTIGLELPARVYRCSECLEEVTDSFVLTLFMFNMAMPSIIWDVHDRQEWEKDTRRLEDLRKGVVRGYSI